MALTRKFLSALGIDADKIDEIITAHSETVDALKEQANTYKVDAEKLPAVQKELKELKESVADGGDDWKKKYEEEHSAFETYKKKVADERTLGQVREAYKKLLVDCKVDEKRIETVLKVTNLGDMKLNKDGKFEGEDKIVENIKSEWSEFIKSEGNRGADVDNPPNDGAAMTKEAFEKLPLNEQMEYANNHPSEVSTFYK